MNLHEHQATEYGIPVPTGSVRQALAVVEHLDPEARVHTIGLPADKGARLQAVLV